MRDHRDIWLRRALACLPGIKKAHATHLLKKWRKSLEKQVDEKKFGFPVNDDPSFEPVAGVELRLSDLHQMTKNDAVSPRGAWLLVKLYRGGAFLTHGDAQPIGDTSELEAFAARWNLYINGYGRSSAAQTCRGHYERTNIETGNRRRSEDHLELSHGPAQ